MKREDKISGVWFALFIPWLVLFMWDMDIINNPFFIAYTAVFIIATYFYVMLVGFG